LSRFSHQRFCEQDLRLGRGVLRLDLPPVRVLSLLVSAMLVVGYRSKQHQALGPSAIPLLAVVTNSGNELRVSRRRDVVPALVKRGALVIAMRGSVAKHRAVGVVLQAVRTEELPLQAIVYLLTEETRRGHRGRPGYAADGE
jgi:hypothetical protein